MYEITVKGATLAELYACMKEFLSSQKEFAAEITTLAQPETQAAANPTPAVGVPTAATTDTTLAPSAAPTASVTPTMTTFPSSPISAVPVSTAPTYTIEDLARAGATLLQSGKLSQQQSMDLLAKYGAQSLSELKPEVYGAFATELRAYGAQI